MFPRSSPRSPPRECILTHGRKRHDRRRSGDALPTRWFASGPRPNCGRKSRRNGLQNLIDHFSVEAAAEARSTSFLTWAGLSASPATMTKDRADERETPPASLTAERASPGARDLTAGRADAGRPRSTGRMAPEPAALRKWRDLGPDLLLLRSRSACRSPGWCFTSISGFVLEENRELASRPELKLRQGRTRQLPRQV